MRDSRYPGIAALFAACLVVGCGEEDDEPTPLSIGGYVFNLLSGDTRVSITINQGASAVSDADVTVNSVTIPHTTGATYALTSGLVIAADEAVVLAVTRGDLSASASLTMPDIVTLTAPTGGQDASLDIPVVWTLPSPAPEKIRLLIGGTFTASDLDWTVEVDGTETTVDIPADTLKAGTGGMYLTAMSVNTGAVTGDVVAGSSINAEAWTEISFFTN